MTRFLSNGIEIEGNTFFHPSSLIFGTFHVQSLYLLKRAKRHCHRMESHPFSNLNY
jgi:hypothetical protein